MSSFRSLEMGLSFLCGCVLLGLAAELYYLLWWKRKFSKKSVDNEGKHFSSSNFTLSCWKKPYSSKVQKPHEKDLQKSVSESESHGEEQDPEMGLGKDLLLKGVGEESMDLELMRLHNLSGPPRFLFTINEETREDLESEKSQKGSRTMSLGDLLVTLEPLPSSPLKVNFEAQEHHGLTNPLFESNEMIMGINKLRSSPPPTFKFLRDAEEKLLKRLMLLESDKKSKVNKDEDFLTKTEEKDGSFVKLGVCRGKSEGIHPQISTSSQVLPLASSPSNDNQFN